MKNLTGIIVLAIALTLILLFVGYKITAPAPISADDVRSPQQVQTIKLNADTIFNLVNAERAKNGLKPLIRDARLDATAQSRVDDMVTRNYFSHNDPITGEKMIDKQNAGCHFSENIGVTNGYSDDNLKQMESWMNSKPHHDAILKADYTHTGVAVNGNKVVQHFCTE